MMVGDTVEPRWLDLETLGSDYEQQLDANSRTERLRHRLRSFTGEAEREWVDGPAPGRNSAIGEG